MNEELKKFLLEKGLTDEDVKKFDEALGDKKVMFDDENFVPLSRIKAKNKEIDSLNKIIEQNDKDLSKLKKAVNDDDTKETIAAMEKENAGLKQKLEETKVESAIELAFSDLPETKRKAAIALLDKEKIKLVDGEVVGIDEQNKTLRENEENGFIFNATETPPGADGTGGKGNFGKGGGASGAKTSFFDAIKDNQAKRN